MDLIEPFKEAFRAHPAGIAIITAATAEGPVGLTASSVASVGLDPAALVFSVTRSTGSAGAILAAPSFLVHLIDDEHEMTARQFSFTGGERFTAEQGWETLPSGEPHLANARAALRCEAMQVTRVGESSVVVAEVLEVLMGRRTRPLVYYDRRFHTLNEAQ